MLNFSVTGAPVAIATLALPSPPVVALALVSSTVTLTPCSGPAASLTSATDGAAADSGGGALTVMLRVVVALPPRPSATVSVTV